MIDSHVSRPPSAAADSANEAKAYEIPLPAPHYERPSIYTTPCGPNRGRGGSV